MGKALLIAALLALSGCVSSHPVHPAGQADFGPFSNAPSVEVHLASCDFTPPVIHMRAGHPYRLTLVNDSNSGHDFAAPVFFAGARVLERDGPLIAKGEVELRGGATRTVHVIPARGTYKVVCTHLGHALLGMTARIVVD